MIVHVCCSSLTGHGLTAQELPAAVWGVKRLTTLDLTNNKLESLAPEVGQLTDLKTLKLDHNRFDAEVADLFHSFQQRVWRSRIVLLSITYNIT